jgi:hypothetical protein
MSYLVITVVVIVVIVAEESRILPAPEVLLEATFALRVDITSAAKEGKKYR